MTLFLQVHLLTTLLAASLPGSGELRQMVGTMFMVRPETIAVDISTGKSQKGPATELTDAMRSTYELYPAGGFCLFAPNIVDSLQLKKFTGDLHSLPGRPLLSVDEEGGRVSRIAINKAFGLVNRPSAGKLAAAADTGAVSSSAVYIGTYLKRYGFDIDFAPVADVNTNPDNPVIGTRAFGSDPVLAGKMVGEWVEGLQSCGVCACLKHFPGHGDTRTDSHKGQAESSKTLDEIRGCEMIPFRQGIASGAGMVMVAHIGLPSVTLSHVPATLSPDIVTGLLRQELGYDGVVVTDAMEMGAVSGRYASGEAAILAILAGVDIVLIPGDYRKTFDAVVEAVLSGRIPLSRIEESVRRINALKNRFL